MVRHALPAPGIWDMHAASRMHSVRPDRAHRLHSFALPAWTLPSAHMRAAFTMGDHQRYFFFQTMSTVGALLLLVVHGPGKLSMDEQQGQLVLITTHNA